MSSIDYSVYLVTDSPDRYPDGLVAGVAAALQGGVGIVQYRPTAGSRREQFQTAGELKDLLKPRGIPLIVNDQVDLALAVDADGVHVGQADLPADVVRRLIGPRKLLGLSITLADQLEHVPSHVDYVGVGPVFPTPTKQDAAAALGLEGLSHITARAGLPVVAIGGITVRNAAEVFATGVQGIAVVSAISQAADPAAVVRTLRAARAGGRS